MVSNLDGRNKSKIRTNNRWSEFLSWCDLSTLQKEEYLGCDDDTFVKYKKDLYNLNEFTRLNGDGEFGQQGFHAALSTSAFSALLLKLSPDCDSYQIAFHVQ